MTQGEQSMRSIQVGILAAALACCASLAQAQTATQEYFGLVCQSEPLARAIGEGFRQEGGYGFERRAAIAIGNGCSFIGPYVLPDDPATTTITSWVYEDHMLTLRVTRALDVHGREVHMYGYVVTSLNTA